jgi:type IV pilus assembly protein PilO
MAFNLGLDKLQPMLEKIAKLPSHYRTAVVVAIPLVLGLGYYQLLHSGSQEELVRLRAQEQSLQRKLNEVRSVAANLGKFEEEIAALEAELGEALRQLPNSKELPGLLTDISTLGKKAGLEFKAFRPQTEVNKGFYAEVPIEIEFTGSYHQVASFFDRIAKLDRIVNIGDLNMTIGSEGLDQTVLKVSGRAVTFRFVEGGGA